MQKIILKSSGDSKDPVCTHVCALANTGGGLLVINSDVSEMDPQSPNKLVSATGADVRIVKHKDKPGIDIVVNSSDFPLQYHGRYYSIFGGRVFDSTAQVEAELREKEENSLWLEKPCQGISVDDLDWHAIEAFRLYASESDDDSFQDLSDIEVLDQLDLLSDGTPTLAAVLLFHSRPESIITNSDTYIS